MARKEFLDYVWKYCIEPQLGYSFSLNHTLPYSLIAVQEANLATRWNPLYWQCACLCVNAGNYVKELGEDSSEDVDSVELQEEEQDEDVKKEKRVAPEYGKIAKAIAEAQKDGVKIALPYINEAQKDFVPNIEKNEILYSLQAMSSVGTDLLEKILQLRPFSSFEDFYERVEPSTGQICSLIKAGCFDELYQGVPRKTIANNFLKYLAEKEIPRKEKMTTVQLKKALELGMDLEKYNLECRIFKFKKFIDSKMQDKPNKRYILFGEKVVKFFNDFIKPGLSLQKSEYSFLPDDRIGVKMSAFKREFDKRIEPLIQYLNSDAGLDAFTEVLRRELIQQNREKYFSGNQSSWEMETMSFYYSGHELRNLNNAAYDIKDFFSLPID